MTATACISISSGTRRICRLASSWNHGQLTRFLRDVRTMLQERAAERGRQVESELPFRLLHERFPDDLCRQSVGTIPKCRLKCCPKRETSR